VTLQLCCVAYYSSIQYQCSTEYCTWKESDVIFGRIKGEGI